MRFFSERYASLHSTTLKIEDSGLAAERSCDMKKAMIAMIVLIIAFFTIWAIKLRSTVEPVDPFTPDASGSKPWWQSAPNAEPTPDADWVLDPEIPDNCIPVLGGNELYMVVDEDGNIIKYRRRVKQEDGSWLWEDVNPDIPENYEAVPGLDNVYKVTNADGTVHYYRYTRNQDDTYYFTEVDEHGNPLKKDDALSNDAIPANYVHVSGNIYAVYNEHGVLIGYKMRVENEDGTFSWVDCDPPQGGNQWGGGGIPNMNQGTGTSGNTNVTIINPTQEPTKINKTEEKVTDIKQEGEWTVVYETTVIKTYDEYGELLKTEKSGPTEINRFPTTDVSQDILDRFLNGAKK